MINLVSASHATEKKVVIPDGVVAASQEQKTFIQALQKLTFGATRGTVEKALGPPTSEEEDRLIYRIEEDRTSGGYYIIAALTFVDGRMSSADVNSGHSSKSRR